jgi:predicted MPP superfamily phosphohydrolase
MGGVALRLGVATLLAAAAALLYTFFVEPFWIEVTTHSIAGPVGQRLRIAHLSDLHSSGFGLREREMVTLLGRVHPDLIVVTGDVVDGGSLEPVRDLFRGLRAPLGVWVVRGDSDAGVRPEAQAVFYRSVGAHYLENQGAMARDDLFVVGLTDVNAARSDPASAFGAAPAAAFKLALFHAPDDFAAVAGLFHLGLAGHSHGGQVRIPGFPPLWQPVGGRRYTQGVVHLERLEPLRQPRAGDGAGGGPLQLPPGDRSHRDPAALRRAQAVGAGAEGAVAAYLPTSREMRGTASSTCFFPDGRSRS